MNSSEAWEQMREQTHRASTRNESLPLALPELSGYEKTDGKRKKV